MVLFTCFKKSFESDLEKKITEIVECMLDKRMKQENQTKEVKLNQIVTEIKEPIEESI
jgi:hypothetical protein